METIKARVERYFTPDVQRRILQSMQDMKHKFTEHPGETGETYVEHLIFTLQMGVRIISCGTLLLIHGLFPFTLRHTVSGQIEKIYAILKGRIPKHRLQEIDANWHI